MNRPSVLLFRMWSWSFVICSSYVSKCQERGEERRHLLTKKRIPCGHQCTMRVTAHRWFTCMAQCTELYCTASDVLCSSLWTLTFWVMSVLCITVWCYAMMQHCVLPQTLVNNLWVEADISDPIEVKEWEILSSRAQRLAEKHYELISLVIVESGERGGSGGSKTGVLKLGTTF